MFFIAETTWVRVALWLFGLVPRWVAVREDIALIETSFRMSEALDRNRADTIEGFTRFEDQSPRRNFSPVEASTGYKSVSKYVCLSD